MTLDRVVAVILRDVTEFDYVNYVKVVEVTPYTLQ